jgi:hypothetical protein
MQACMFPDQLERSFELEDGDSVSVPVKEKRIVATP